MILTCRCQVQAMIERLRLELKARGVGGMRGLVAAMQRTDSSGTGTLSADELSLAFSACGIQCTRGVP